MAKKPGKSGSGMMALKGVYTLNPTDAVMKTGSLKARKAVTEDVPGFKKIKRVKTKTLSTAKGKGKTKWRIKH